MDWNYWLGRKYDIMQQGADAETSRAASLGLTSTADAKLSNVKAGLLPAESENQNALTRAQARSTNVTADLAPDLAKASEAASYAGAYANRQQGGLYGAQAAGENQNSSVLSSALGGDSNTLKILQALGFLKPTAAAPARNGFGFLTGN